MIRIRREYQYEDHPEFGFGAEIPVWVKYRASIRKTLFGHRWVVWTEVQRSETYSDLLNTSTHTHKATPMKNSIYEIYTEGNSLYMLTTEQNLYDILIDKNHKGWYFKEISLVDAICKYGNMPLANRRALESR